MPAVRPSTGAGPAPHAVETAYRRETAQILCRRLDITIALYLLLVGTSIVLEGVFHPERTRLAILSYGLHVGLCALAAVCVRLPGFARRPAGVGAVLGATLGTVLSWYNAQVGGSVERFATAQVCLLSGLFVLLPWGWRAQLAVGVVTLAGFGLQGAADAEALSYAILALATGIVTSVVGAYFLERYRFDAFMRTALLTDASARAREEAELATTLARVSETLTTHAHEPDGLARVNGLAVQAMGCDWSSTFVWDDTSAAFRFHAHAGLRDEVAAELAEIAIGRDSMPIVGALRPGATIEIPDATRTTLVPPELLRRWEVASELVVPISRRQDVIGVLCFGYRTRTGPFSPGQHRLALGLAHATAIAFENARLIADLQAANQLKSNFVATMSHELRTPLNVVTGYADLLAEGTFGALTPEQADTVARIHQSALELLELVNATLDLGRLEAGREEVHLAPVDLDAVLAEVERDIAPLVPPHLTLAWDRTPDCGRVVTDRGKVKTILKNLLGNALKFTPAGRVDVAASSDGDALRLVVRDTGIGIAAADLPGIFEMFRQVDGSSTRRFGGVGLGLHIVQRLVGLLGGTIDVESMPGVGSTFTITLPRAPTTTEDVAPSPPVRANSGGTRAGS